MDGFAGRLRFYSAPKLSISRVRGFAAFVFVVVRMESYDAEIFRLDIIRGGLEG